MYVSHVLHTCLKTPHLMVIKGTKVGPWLNTGAKPWCWLGAAPLEALWELGAFKGFSFVYTHKKKKKVIQHSCRKLEQDEPTCILAGA